ncbi:hypothetical protein JCM18899A_17050 [Nocardioides sp. AN3]
MTTLLTPSPQAGAPTAVPERWSRWGRHGSLLALLTGTGVLYLWTLSESGYANSFYSAAAQAGSQSWKAFFFGSLDAGNSITVDKPPAALWLMDLSVRFFGLSPWSVLVPEALLGVATVGLVYAGVCRTGGHAAGLVAGAATALTPSAALMFRFNNPDALLLFLLVAAGYATLRAAEAARGRWLVLAGALVGLAFLTKMLQAFLVLPAFALVYLLAAPTSLRRRLLHLLGAFAALVASAGWWIAIVELVPASARPFIDGSTDNSILQLVIGYNGLGRITGAETGGLGNGGFSSGVGPLRIFQGVSGGMVSWLMPAALMLAVAGVAFRGRAPRTDGLRAALLLNGLAMITTAGVFSFMAGIYHDYYTVALAPWIAGTAVLGWVAVWRERRLLAARLVLIAAVLASTAWAFTLLGQSGQQPYDALRWVVLVSGFTTTAALLVADRLSHALTAGVLGVVLVSGLTGPAAYAVDTVVTPHTGSIVTAGPVSSRGGPGGGFGRQGGPGGFPGGLRGLPGGQPGARPNGAPGGVVGGRTGGMPRGGGLGGVLGGSTVSSDLKAMLLDDAGSYTWVAATTGAQSAASYQLATGEPVMAMGGFNGTAGSPTLAQFQSYVAEAKVHYFISGGGIGGTGAMGRMGGMRGGQGGSLTQASQIATWVSESFTAKTVDGVTVYDLTQPASGSPNASGDATTGVSS